MKRLKQSYSRFLAMLLAFVMIITMIPATAFAAENDAVVPETVAVESISLDKEDISLSVGETASIAATIMPENATDKTIKWTSDHEEIVTVADGTVTAVAEGEAVVTASAGECTVTCRVIVTKSETDEIVPYVLDVSSNEKPHKWNYVNTITVEDVTVKEADCTAGDSMDVNIVLDSSTALDASFTVSFWAAGRVAEKYPMTYDEASGFNTDGVKTVNLVNGGAFFSVTTTGPYSSKKSSAAVWNFTISIDGVEAGLSITPDQVELKGIEATTTLTALNADEDVTWVSSDESVATVSQDGVVTSISLGTATITATSGDQTAECQVSVVGEAVLNVGTSVQKPSVNWGYLDTITVKGDLLVKEWSQDDTTVNIVLPKDTASDASFDLLFTGAGTSTRDFDVQYNGANYKDGSLSVQLEEGKKELSLHVVGGNTSCDWTIKIQVAEDDSVAVHRKTIATGAGYIDYTTDVWCSEVTVVGPEVKDSKVTEYEPADRKIVVLFNEDTAADAEGKLEFTTGSVDNNEFYKTNMKYNVDSPYSFKLEDGKAELALTTGGNQNPAVERMYQIILKNSNTAPSIIEGVQNVTTDWETQAVYSVDLSEIFEDADDDALDYTVSIDGTESPFIDEKWSYPADTTGEHKLIFTASDGLTVSEEFTVTLNVKNNEETYDVTFHVPEQIAPAFYVNGGYDGVNGDILGDALNMVKRETSDGLTKYVVRVPNNVTTVSFRGTDTDGTNWGGMTVAVEEGTQPITLRMAKGVVDTLLDGKALSADEAAFRILNANKNYAVSGGSAEEDGKLTYRFLLVAGIDYTYQTVAIGTFAERYGIREAAAENVSDDTTEIKMFALPIALKNYFTVTVPEGSSVLTGKLISYYIFNFVEPFYQINNVDGTVTYELERLPDENSDGSIGGSQFIKVSHPDGVTYWDYESKREGNIEITKEMLFIGDDDGFDADTIFHDFEEYDVDVADIYLSVNKQMYVDLDVSETYEINVFRNWYAINNFSNNAVALPDVHYQVINIDGSASDVVSVTPEEHNSSIATITANKEGTAIVLVTYDAMYHAGALQGALGNERPQPEKFSAIWPENTGVFVVSVGTDGTSIQTNMNIDAEHDPIYYVGDEGAIFSFTPEAGTTVSVARAIISNNRLTYDGFSTNNVNVDAETGEVTVAWLTEGRHIIKIEKDGVATYQVVATKQTTMSIKDSEGNIITPDTPVPAGTELTVQFGDLYNPINKLSGIYNTNCAVYYQGEDGTTFEGSAGSNMGYYLFGSNAGLHQVTITVPSTWSEATYTLQGSFKIGGFGSSGGAHRGILLYKTGKDVQNEADGVKGNPGILPEITISVQEGTSIETVPVTGISLNKETAQISVGSTLQLQETIVPENATNKNVTWTSSDDTVVKVTNGIVSAIAEGEAVITATAGDFSAQCKVTVIKKNVSDNKDNGDGVASVYLSISDDDKFLTCEKTGTVMALKKLDVPYFNLADYGLEGYGYAEDSENYGKVTALHLYIYAMETCYYGVNPDDAGKGYLYKENILGTDMMEISGNAGSLFFEKFWGMDMNLNYYHNYQYPIASGTTGATADQIILRDGDIITVGHFANYGFYDDPTSIFNYVMAGDATVSTTAVRGLHTLSIYRAGANMGASFGTANEPMEMALDVYYSKVGDVTSGDVTTWTKLGTTDASGKITVDLSGFEPGQYIFATPGRNGSKHTTAICSAPGGIVLNVLNDDDSKTVNDVIALIDTIGEVTLNDEEAITCARTAYDNLSDEQKEAVSNYADLKAAEEKLLILKASEDDKAKALAVDALIEAIGEVTLEDEATIESARIAYEELTDTQKLFVTKLDVLVAAEKALKILQDYVPIDATTEEIYNTTGNYIASLGTPSVGSIGGEWMALGLARSGKNVPDDYYDNVLAYVKDNINSKNQLHRAKSTDNSRVILALTSVGCDPRNVGGYNLLEGLTDMNYVTWQGNNGAIWALIAFDSHNYEIPTAPEGANQVTRDKLVAAILNAQLEDGGWALSGIVSDVDMTGMAIQALAPYYETNTEVKAAVDKALAYLSEIQLSDGSFGSIDGSNAESCAQVIVALTALGINPDTDSRFVKDGNSVVDALCSFYVDEGGFRHVIGNGLNGMATEQGYYALTAYMRFLDGKTALYDMSDVEINKGTASDDNSEKDEQEKLDQAAAEKVEELIDDIGNVTVNSETRIKKARNAYENLTSTQKKLISNYQDLVDAEKALEEAKVKHVEDLIDSIGTVTLDSKTKIDRARTAYKNLTKDNQKAVSNLDVLEAAEAAYAKLLAEQKEEQNNKTDQTTDKESDKTTGTNKKPVNKTEETKKDYTKIAETVAEMLDTVTNDSKVGEIVDVILAYEELTEEEKAALDQEATVEELKEKVKALVQTDSKTGISVSGVDWNIRVVVEEILNVEQIQTLQKKLDGNSMLAFWDIYLEDMTTGERYEPSESIAVKMPLNLLGDYSAYDGIAVVHYTDDGRVEYLNSAIVGEYIVFNTVEFSNYAVVGYNGTAPTDGLANEDTAGTADMPWIPWAIAGGFGVLLLAALLVIAKKKSHAE